MATLINSSTLEEGSRFCGSMESCRTLFLVRESENNDRVFYFKLIIDYVFFSVCY